MSSFKRATSVVLILGIGATVSGCSWMSSTFGSSKRPPDEFEVVGKAPLAMPPDFNLRPPRPGQPRPQELSSSAVAINALFPGRTTLPPAGSAGEAALISKIDQSVDGSVDARSNVGDGQTLVVDKGVLLRDIIGSPEREMASEGNTIERVGSDPVND